MDWYVDVTYGGPYHGPPLVEPSGTRGLVSAFDVDAAVDRASTTLVATPQTPLVLLDISSLPTETPALRSPLGGLRTRGGRGSLFEWAVRGLAAGLEPVQKEDWVTGRLRSLATDALHAPC